jgi:hypothetical protein
VVNNSKDEGSSGSDSKWMPVVIFGIAGIIGIVAILALTQRHKNA